MPALLLLVLATLFWAGNYVVGERAVATIDPLSLTWLRWAFAVVPLVVIAHVIERPDWGSVLRRWRFLLLMAGLGVAGYPLLLYAALEHTTAVSASLINAANPALIVVTAVLLSGTRVGARSWSGVVLGLLGVLLVLTGGDLGRLLALQLNLGDLLMLGAIVVWTLYTLLGQSLGIPVLTATAVQAVFTVVGLVPFLMDNGLAVPSTSGPWWAVIFIAAFPSVGSYICWNLGITRVSSGTAAASMNLVTLFTIVIAALLGEPPTTVQLLGGALVVGGVLLTTSRPRAPAPAVDT